MPRLVAGNRAFECSLVVFDKNGTLVDQHSVLLELAQARKVAIQRLSGERVADLWERIVGVNVANGKIDYQGPLGTAPRREELLLAAEAFYLNGFSWDESKRIAQQAYDMADGSMKPPYGSVLLKGIEGTLKKLKKSQLKLAIASTDTHKRTVESFKALNMASIFDVIVGSDDVQNGKPSPDMILTILKATDCRPEATVVVGDSMSDMQMGRNAGVQACIGVLMGSAKKEELEQTADAVVDSVAKLHLA
jgi:phosphoglycolate phosphatase